MLPVSPNSTPAQNAWHLTANACLPVICTQDSQMLETGFSRPSDLGQGLPAFPFSSFVSLFVRSFIHSFILQLGGSSAQGLSQKMQLLCCGPGSTSESYSSQISLFPLGRAWPPPP